MPSISRKSLKTDVMLVTPDFPLWDGGISTVAYQLSRALAAAGKDVLVVTPKQTEGDLSFDRTLDFPICRLRNPKARLVKPLYQRVRLLTLLARHRPAAIISCCWYPSSLALLGLTGLIAGPLLTVVHGSELIRDKFRSPFWQGRMLRSLERADILVAVSGYVKTMLVRLGLPSAKIKVIGNGVDAQYFNRSEYLESMRRRHRLENARVVVTVARLVARKGQDVVLRALPRVLEELPDIKYLIVGKGAYESELKAMTKQLNLDKHVIFAGFVPAQELSAYFQVSEVFVMPSRTEKKLGDLEGFGISFLEANACGRPVVAGRSGGVEDAVIHGETGLLVNPESETEVAEAIIALLTDTELAERLGRQGKDRVLKQFTWDRIARSYLDLMGM